MFTLLPIFDCIAFCDWQVYPSLDDSYKSSLPPGSFITCSSDDTIRVWNIDSHMTTDVMKRNIYSNVSEAAVCCNIKISSQTDNFTEESKQGPIQCNEGLHWLHHAFLYGAPHPV